MPRPREEARLVKLPGKENWYIKDGSVRINGRCLTRSTRTVDKVRAECLLAQYIAEKSMPLAPTISDMLDMRLKDLQARGTSRGKQNVYLHKILKKYVGPLEMHQFSTALVNKMQEDYVKSVSMQRVLIEELLSTFNLAYREGLITKVPYIKKPEPNPPRDRFLTQEEVKALFQAAEPLPHLRLYIYLSLMTGARKGAVLGLTWDRVDLIRGIIDFQDPTKRITKKRRPIVPVSQDVVETLKEYQKFAQTNRVIEYMGKPLKDIKRSFNNAVAKAGLKNVTPHVLKHTAVSWMAQAGRPMENIANFTNTSIPVLRRVYAKVNPEKMQAEAECLSKNMSFAAGFAEQPTQAKELS